MREFAKKIADARISGHSIDALSPELGLSIDDGYALQHAVNAKLIPDLGPLGGSKIGASNEVLQKYLGIDEPLAGDIFASSIVESPAELIFSSFQKPGIETEIGVTLGHAVAPGAPWQDAIATLHTAIEIVDNRYESLESAGPVTFVADNVFNAASIKGPAIHNWRDLPLEKLNANTRINGELIETGSSAALLGGPIQALTWLFDLWRRQGRTAPQGWFISLGTMTMVQWLDGPCTVDIEVEHLGSVSCRLI